MKRHILIVLSLAIIPSTGCITGRSDGRPGFFRSTYDRLHGRDNVGAPCNAGSCFRSAPVALPPQPGYLPQAAITPPCESCGPTSLSYPDYSSYEMMGSPAYEGEVYNGTSMGSPIESSYGQRLEVINP